MDTPGGRIHVLFNTETGTICATADFSVLRLDPTVRKLQPFLAKVALRATELKLPPLKL